MVFILDIQRNDKYDSARFVMNRKRIHWIKLISFCSRCSRCPSVVILKFFHYLDSIVLRVGNLLIRTWYRFCKVIDRQFKRGSTMKKSITLFLIILSTALFADSALTHVETIIQNSRPADLPAIAGNYSALGSTHQIKGDYAKALENYKNLNTEE